MLAAALTSGGLVTLVECGSSLGCGALPTHNGGSPGCGAKNAASGRLAPRERCHWTDQPAQPHGVRHRGTGIHRVSHPSRTSCLKLVIVSPNVVEAWRLERVAVVRPDLSVKGARFGSTPARGGNDGRVRVGVLVGERFEAENVSGQVRVAAPRLRKTSRRDDVDEPYDAMAATVHNVAREHLRLHRSSACLTSHRRAILTWPVPSDNGLHACVIGSLANPEQSTHAIGQVFLVCGGVTVSLAVQ